MSDKYEMTDKISLLVAIGLAALCILVAVVKHLVFS